MIRIAPFQYISICFSHFFLLGLWVNFSSEYERKQRYRKMANLPFDRPYSVFMM